MDQEREAIPSSPFEAITTQSGLKAFEVAGTSEKASIN